MNKLAKRGRRRKEGKRHPNGKLVQRTQKAKAMKPTPELLAKKMARLAIAGSHNPDMLEFAESWLGVCHAAGWISYDQYRAGCHYQGLYKTVFPQAFPQTTMTTDKDAVQDGEPGNELSDEALESIEESLRLATDLLKQIGGDKWGNRIFNTVRDVAVYDRFMKFMDTQTNRTEMAWKRDQVDRTHLRGGLDALARAFGYSSPKPFVVEINEAA